MSGVLQTTRWAWDGLGWGNVSGACLAVRGSGRRVVTRDPGASTGPRAQVAVVAWKMRPCGCGCGVPPYDDIPTESQQSLAESSLAGGMYEGEHKVDVKVEYCAG